MVGMILAGFKNGELVIAKQVDPDKCGVLAEKLELIATHCNRMAEALGDKAAIAALDDLIDDQAA